MKYELIAEIEEFCSKTYHHLGFAALWLAVYDKRPDIIVDILDGALNRLFNGVNLAFSLSAAAIAAHIVTRSARRSERYEC